MTEMVRVAKEKVCITTGWQEATNPQGIVKYGIGQNVFEFKLRDFATEMEKAGVTHVIEEIPPRSPDEYPQYAIHFNTTQKDNQKLIELRESLENNADEMFLKK
jgi:hypothetical protein